MTKRKNETYHEYYLRTIDQFKKQRSRHWKRYKNDKEYRAKILAKQRNKRTLEIRTQTLKRIEELENQWPVSENQDITIGMTEREKMIMLAALIMGEGSISMYLDKSGKYPIGRATMTLTNTDLDILELFKILFTESNFIKTKPEKYSPRWRPAFQLRIYKQEIVLNYLIKIRPFLVGRKRKVADIIIDIIKFRLTQPNDEWGRMIVPEIEKKIAEINELNRRGVIVTTTE